MGECICVSESRRYGGMTYRIASIVGVSKGVPVFLSGGGEDGFAFVLDEDFLSGSSRRYEDITSYSILIIVT